MTTKKRCGKKVRYNKNILKLKLKKYNKNFFYILFYFILSK